MGLAFLTPCGGGTVLPVTSGETGGENCREARHGSADIYGNTLEALIGAIFLDRGYTKAEEFVHHRVLPLFIELEQSLREQTTNYKSLLLEWTQKHRLSLDFRMLQEPKRSGASFICGVYISDRKVGVGSGLNKKEAHQDAAHRALLALCEADSSVAEELGLRIEDLMMIPTEKA